MKLTQISNYTGFNRSKIENYIKAVDTDFTNIFNALKGRIRFGAATTSYRGENISGEYRVFTSNTAGTNDTVTHTLKAQPTGFILMNKNGFGDIYMVSSTTANAVFASSLTSVTYTVFLCK